MLCFALHGARWRCRRYPARRKSSASPWPIVITAGTLRLNWRRGLMRPEKISGQPLGVINRRSIPVKHSEGIQSVPCKALFPYSSNPQELAPGRREIFRVSSGRCKESLAGSVSSLHAPPEGNQNRLQIQIMRTATPKSSRTSTTSAPVRILVADDHEVMRLGVRNLLEARPGWSICAEASNGKEAIEKTLESRPDIIVLDIAMPVMNGLEAAVRIAETAPQVPIILFSLHLSDDLIDRFPTDRIRGAVAKGDSARDLVDAIETVLSGGTFFPNKKSLRASC